MHEKLKLGIAFEARDYEPDPNVGILSVDIRRTVATALQIAGTLAAI